MGQFAVDSAQDLEEGKIKTDFLVQVEAAVGPLRGQALHPARSVGDHPARIQPLVVQDGLQLLPEVGPAIGPRQQVRDRSVTSL